jgi:hypothetical protein
MTRPPDEGSGFEGSCSESIDDNDEVVVGGEAGGCACDSDAVVVGMGEGYEADIAAPFLRACICSRGQLVRRVTRDDRMLEESRESVEVLVELVDDLFDTRVGWALKRRRESVPHDMRPDDL